MADFNDFLNGLLDALGPSSAQAEMIPETPGAKAALEAALSDPTEKGAAVRALHARPEKVAVTDNPDLASRMMGTMGRFNPALTGKADYRINLSPEVIKYVAKVTGKDEMLNTLSHESGHGLGQISGLTGSREPVSRAVPGSGVMNFLANIMGLRVPQNVNEGVADYLSGQLPNANPDIKALGDRIKKLMAMQKKAEE